MTDRTEAITSIQFTVGTNVSRCSHLNAITSLNYSHIHITNKPILSAMCVYMIISRYLVRQRNRFPNAQLDEMLLIL